MGANPIEGIQDLVMLTPAGKEHQMLYKWLKKSTNILSIKKSDTNLKNKGWLLI